MAALQRLAVGRLAVVTARPAETAVRLGGLDRVPGLVVLGQYGAQRWSRGRLHSAAPAPGLDLARRELPGLASVEGARVEDKGLSLVLHTRTAPDPAGALVRLAGPLGDLAARSGLELHAGRLVLELRPPGFDKCRAVLSLADPPPSALLVAGDDVGDLGSWDALDQLRTGGVPGLAVASLSPEIPPALLDRADLVVEGPAGVVALLGSLAEATAPRA